MTLAGSTSDSSFGQLGQLVEEALLDQPPQAQRHLAEKRAGVEDVVDPLYSGTDPFLAPIAHQAHRRPSLIR